jgi:hypothetical protein
MRKPEISALLGLLLAGCLFCSASAYLKYIDWPSLGGDSQVRRYIPSEYPIQDAHHYTYRNFMDTWELYRFTTTPEAIAHLANSLNLSAPTTVHEFDLIVSRPPPYWWHPESLDEGQLYRSEQRAPDGHLYDLLYSVDLGIAYFIRFDG